MPMRFVLAAGLMIGVLAAPVPAATFHAAPLAQGRGDGARPDDAASYTDAALWKNVGETLGQESVTVRFLPGTYTAGPLRLTGLGHDEHRLELAGAPEHGTIFKAVDPGLKQTDTGLFLRDCRNVVVRGLCFTGDGHIGYISQVRNCNRVRFEACLWTDLPHIRYGACGSSNNSTHITWKDCAFRRVGVHGGAHMLYNAYTVRHIYAIGCTFVDCAGDYVRWRDDTDCAAAVDCAFRSTGTWPPENPVHAAFISVPLFNDADPGDEWFGTHFLITGNTFEYAAREADGWRTVLRFLHRGYDPPERRHLLTAGEGAVLESGSAAERAALLKANCGIDVTQIHVFENICENTTGIASFSSSAAYGAQSRGWEGRVAISDLLNRKPGMPDWYDPFSEAH